MALFTIDDFNEMQEETHRILGEYKDAPGPDSNTLSTILNYSRSLGVKNTRSLGKVLMNLN
jgi:hypothetical protein